jgi:predicted P-loop ATPase
MWCNKLLPDQWKEYFITKNIDPSQKDDMIIMSEKYVIFMDEGISLKKSDARALKSLMSTSKYSGRAAYGRYNKDYIRYASFIASTNDINILSDDTGSRRYWIVNTSSINHNHNIDMLQTWAQALYLYKNNEQYWLTDQEVKEVNEKNKVFEVEDDIESYLNKWIRYGDDFHTATEIRDYVLDNEKNAKNSYFTPTWTGRKLNKMGIPRVKRGNKIGYMCSFNTAVKTISVEKIGIENMFN